jgi:DNA polymerase
LLDKILEACGFTRQQHVFISNIVKCRPPDNRVPSPAEASICMRGDKPDRIDQPGIMILLGSTALKYMAGPDYKITRDRGNGFHAREADNARLSPAALLRDPSLNVTPGKI